ncbi:MAG: heparan-alpha-glucosaminide N-acetyltransferase domain-containing protein [Candidatus ainarchaeum sp.]|nr:heparan-alpha-glucosaminide N-acetyltransferase domain-containing protein [Candidatus ainarchaeum sp.]
MNRNHSIDLFRGISVVLMVFFTLILKLSNSLIDVLNHNVSGSFHFGDLVLPFFIFASGLSLSYFFNKRKKLSNINFFLDILYRIFILGIIWVFISPFSSGMLFGMDEIALILVLFILLCPLIRLRDEYLLLISLILFMLYPILSYNIDFSYYLGGFYASIFYLPIILSGFAIGRSIINNTPIIKKVMLFSFILFIILFYLFPIDKMRASPSFMALSILLASLLFHILYKYPIKNKILQYLGKNSLRYWVLMFVLFIIPVKLLYFSGVIPLPMQFSTIEAIFISLIFLVVFALISYFIDIFTNFLSKKLNRLNQIKRS